jgi:polyisoprenoid-binding protein YceI
LDIKIAAATVDTGSGFKDDKLKSKDFFDAKVDPYITFKSNKFVQTGSDTFDVSGTFTIRGVSKPETLTLTDTRNGTGFYEIKGVMAFDRKEFGMDSGIDPLHQDCRPRRGYNRSQGAASKRVTVDL